MAKLSRFTLVVMLVLSLSAQAYGLLRRVSESEWRYTRGNSHLISHTYGIPTSLPKFAEKAVAAQSPVPCHCHSSNVYRPRWSVDVSSATLGNRSLAAVYVVASMRELTAAAYAMGLFRLFTGGIDRPPSFSSF